MLDYKADTVIPVNSRFTSQTCSSCGHCAAKNRTSQSTFRCLGCGYRLNADVNAARNILALGIGVTADGGAGLPGPMKSEKTYAATQHAA